MKRAAAGFVATAAGIVVWTGSSRVPAHASGVTRCTAPAGNVGATGSIGAADPTGATGSVGWMVGPPLR